MVNREELQRRKVLNLTEQDVAAMLRLPEGTRILGIAGEFDPPRVRVLLVNEEWPLQPYDVEAPRVEKVAVVVDDHVAIVFPELLKDGDPETPSLRTEYRWIAPSEKKHSFPPVGEIVTRDKQKALDLQQAHGGYVQTRLAGDWDLLLGGEE